MKKLLIFLCTVTLIHGAVGLASAIPIDFDMDGAPNSSVELSNMTTWGFWGSSDVTTQLAPGLENEIFTLDDGETYTFDFFLLTINAKGFLSGGSAEITATLAFDLPPVPRVTGIGSGYWATAFGLLSGGTLQWANLPSIITLDNGDYFGVDFEDIYEGGLGNQTIVQATITAYSADVIPIPEPSSMILIATGLLGLTGFLRKFRT